MLALAALLAMLIGSFLNVCIARLPRHRSIVLPASHCPRCQAPVRPSDNVPVLSWLLLRGRCRDCRLPISPRYPLVELGYTALVAVSIARFGASPAALAAAVFCFLLLGLLVMDLETMLLPDAFTLPGLALGLLWAFAAPATGLAGRFAAAGQATLAASAWAALLLAIRWVYYASRRRHGLGVGDVKLVAMLAAWLGLAQTAVAFLLAVVAAALAGIFLLAMARARAAEQAPGAWGSQQLPLGTFLCAGALVSLFSGVPLLKWYLKLFA